MNVEKTMLDNQEISLVEAQELSEKLAEASDSPHREPIAVIGMGCWYPGSNNPLKLWEGILARRREFRLMPDCRLPLNDYYDSDPSALDKTYGSRAAVIDGFKFDWVKHRIPKQTYESTDIVHWLALDVALSSLRDAGYSPDSLPRGTSGVILGNTLTGEQTRANTMRLRWPFVRKALRSAAEKFEISSKDLRELETSFEDSYKSVFPGTNEDTLAGGLANTIAGRICNYLNINGGGYVVDGACSSSLIAVATAANSLSSRDLDLALAGGVDISLDTFELVGFSKVGALTAKDMNVYDRKASGFIPGEGCGFVVLKRLEDALSSGDYVYAVLRGWGISSDGKGGITAPAKGGQSLALKRAYSRSGYRACEIDFIEGHGTGTPVGDRTELEGIALAMEQGVNAPLSRHCGVTSLKSLIGHTKAAAGIGAFIKAAMAVNRRVIPPTAGCNELSPVFDDAANCVYPVLQGEKKEESSIVRAGVSGMGFGGINCHVTLESGNSPSKKLEPSINERALLASNQDTELFLLDSGSVAGLIQRAVDLRKLASGMSIGELVDLSADLVKHLKRENTLRASIIASSPDELDNNVDVLLKMLESPPSSGLTSVSQRRDVWVGNNVRKAKIGFLFPGQGSQAINMARKIVERHGWAQAIIDKSDSLMKPSGVSTLSEHIFRCPESALDVSEVQGWQKALSETRIAQPAICVASLLWLNWLRRLGVSPDVVGGHSLGELNAFHAAGAFDDEDLIKLAIERGKSLSSSKGLASEGEAPMMAAISCSKAQAEDFIGQVNGYVVIANVNSGSQIVVSGLETPVRKIVEIASGLQMRTSVIPVSNAFHSDLVKESSERFKANLELPDKFTDNSSVKLISSINGEEILPGHLLREHFAKQVISQVDFVSLTRSMLKECDQLIEVGPRRILSDLANDIAGDPLSCLPIESKADHDRDWNTVSSCLFIKGHNLDWEILFEGRLIREFIPASERLFVENPCERPLVGTSKNSGVSLVNGEDHKLLLKQGKEFTMSLEPAKSSLELESETMRLSGEDQRSSVSPKVLAQALSEYLGVRGNFLASIIQADLENLPSATIGSRRQENKVEEEEKVLVAARSVTRDSDKAKESAVVYNDDDTTVLDKASDVVHDLDLELNQFLVRQAAERTGFPESSITLKSKLLDDLNMDSIKGGELVAAVALKFNVADKIDPSMLANASLEEIADSIKSAVVSESLVAQPKSLNDDERNENRELIQPGKKTQYSDPQNSVLKALVETVVVRTGYPSESVSHGMRLLDDLNLDSIKSAELVAEVATQFNIASKVEPANFANATLQEIADSIESLLDLDRKDQNNLISAKEELRDVKISAEDASHPNLSKLEGQFNATDEHPWVRDFVVEYCLEESEEFSYSSDISDRWDTANIFEPKPWNLAAVLILHEHSDADLCDVLRAELESVGVPSNLIQIQKFPESENFDDLKQFEFTHVFAVLPRSPVHESSSEAYIRKAMARLRGTAIAAQAKSKKEKEHVTISYIQFGGGRFGRHEEPIDIEQGCSVGFASSLHLECSELKVRVIDLPLKVDLISYMSKVLEEVSRPEAYVVAGFNLEQNRVVPRPIVSDTSGYQQRSIIWSPADVMLVSGGAKGITAECALAFAKFTGVKTALVGTSSIPNGDAISETSEVAKTLARFKAEGLSCRYYQCDITQTESVALLVKNIRNELGCVTGVIHGAALNKPRRLENSTLDEAFLEIAPKVQGLLNLCQALEDQPPKLFVGFSSISAVLGLPGNTWYGFSNEAVDLILRKFKQNHAETSILSMAFSVWSEVGMGARMGTVKNLNRMGIEAMPTDEGVRRFLKLMFKDPGDTQVIISARLGGIETLRRGFDTWNTKRYKPDESFQFLEDVRIMEPDVEVVVRTHLNLEKDSYINDHVFRGSYLFPTVFGLEAMAQAASYVTGRYDLTQLHIENIVLERPVVVDPKTGVNIEIHALVEESEDTQSEVRVAVEIKTERTGFTKPHFRATFIFPSQEMQAPVNDIVISPPLKIDPVKDLYSWLLFQGPLFQRLIQIYSLNSKQITFKSKIGIDEYEGRQPSIDRAYGKFILGDPYHRDSLLQSVQPVVPKDICLPIKIERISIYQIQKVSCMSFCLGHVDLYKREGRRYFSNVICVNEDRDVVEQLFGYQLSILEHKEDNPTAEDLSTSSEDHSDEYKLENEVRDRSRSLELSPPETSVNFLPGMSKRSSNERHKAEIPLLTRAVNKLQEVVSRNMY
jgi:enediyne polyketide synthase